MSQDTRTRQNEFFASKNYPFPPPDPELNLMPVVNYVMPPIDDEMFYGYSMPFKAVLVPHVLGLLMMMMRSMKMKTKVKMKARKMMMPSLRLHHLTSCFHLPLYLAPSFLVFRCQGGEVSRVLFALEFFTQAIIIWCFPSGLCLLS
jgi:hypothetical protein